ncbi:hypothetical protein BJX61DRAFT_551254 [Aspergillus egyptiacus]|nr:hypothetical protein BJX61DRAFT_551254 [Aspergillus egyptiacus]
MNPEARRSACDRCRGQKLRCVRPFQAGALSPCERCLNAGGECTNSLSYAQRKLLLETRQSQPSSRIYESIAAPFSVEPVPVKRKLSQSFFERGAAAHYHHPSISFSHPNAGNPIAEVAKAKPLDFGVEPLDFAVRLSPEQQQQHHHHHHHHHQEPDGEDLHKGTSGLVPLETQEDCLHCLSELSSQILRDSNKMRSMPLADILSPQPGLQNSIGRLLDLTQAFANILHCLKLATSSSIPMTPQPSSSAFSSASSSSSAPFHNHQHHQQKQQQQQQQQQQQRRSPPSPSNDSECSYSEYWDEPTHGDENNPRAGAGRNSSLLGAIPEVTATASQASSSASSSSSSSSSASTKLSTQLIPSMLPGLHIGGFDLNSHRDFQLEIILHLSSKMLGRIERLLGISLVSSSTEEMWTGNHHGGIGADGGILDHPSASALLEVLLKQNDLGYGTELTGGVASVKQTLHDIREILRGIM